MNYLRIKNWEEFQHYTNRLPPWIKLHRELLTDYDFCHLPDETKGHLMMTWLLASQMDGRVPDDPRWIAQRIGANKPVNLKQLVDGGWLVREQVASKPLAPRKQSAPVETETYKTTETERETEARALPEWIPKPVWQEFVAYRRQQKGWTAKAESLLLRELGKLHDAGNEPIAVIEQSIANGWKGLFPIRGSSGKREPSLDERRAANIAALTGQVKHERTIEGTAQRMGPTLIPALPGDVRESGEIDVGRCADEGGYRDVG